MTHKKISLFFVMMLISVFAAFAEGPGGPGSGPNGNGTPVGNGGVPVGETAPLGPGTLLLLVFSGIYGTQKTLKMHRNRSSDSV